MFEIKQLMLSVIMDNTNVGSDVILSANSNVCEDRDGEGGRNEQLSPQNRKLNSAYLQTHHLSVPRKILPGFLYFTPAG